MIETFAGLEIIGSQIRDTDPGIAFFAQETSLSLGKQQRLCYTHAAATINHLLMFRQAKKEPVDIVSYRIWYIQGHGVALAVGKDKLYFIDPVGCSTYKMFPGIFAFRPDDRNLIFGNPHHVQSISEDLQLGCNRLETGRPNGQEISIYSFSQIMEIAQKDNLTSTPRR